MAATDVERLRAEVERLETAHRLAGLGSWSMELPSGDLTWSEGMYEILGLDREQTPSIDIYQRLVHPDDQERVAAINQQAMAEGGVAEAVHRIIRPDGEVRRVRAMSRAVMAADRPVRTHGTLQDVTEHEAQSAYFEALMEAAPDAILIVDDKGQITYANRQVEQILGHGREELVGQQVEILIPDALRDAHVAHRADYLEHPKLRPMGRDLELSARHKDGRDIPVEISLSPIDTEGGKRVIAAVRDITQRRRDQHRFESLLESAPDAMVIADDQGRIVLANRRTETLFGYERSELLGQKVEMLVPERFAASHPAQRKAYTKNPVVRPMGAGRELFARHKDGSEFPVEISLSPLETDDGRLIIAAVRDITDRLEAEAAKRLARESKDRIKQLQELTLFKTQLLNTASHELNTPITPLRLQLHLLASGAKGELNEGQQASVLILKRNVERLSGLVADVVDVARLESGKLRLKRKVIPAADLVTEVYEMFQAQATDLQVELTRDTRGKAKLDADRDRLLQVLINFISNAFKFVAAGGHVTIGMEAGQTVRFSVQDDGRGLTDDERGRLFEAFSQVHDPAEVSEPGTGLGLYIAKGIIEQHGGRIGCDSAGLGKGSTFWFELPPAAGASKTPEGSAL